MSHSVTLNTSAYFLGVKGDALPKVVRTARGEVESGSPEEGRALKAARVMAGLSQEEAAEVAGVTSGTVSRWERGTQAIDATTRDRLFAHYKSKTAPGAIDERGISRGVYAPANSRVSPRVYERIYNYLERLRKADVPEDFVQDVYELMSRENFSIRNAPRREPANEAGRFADVDATWKWAKEYLERRGIKV